jgi:hypothetical protein
MKHMQKKLFKALLIFSLGFSSMNIYCAQPNAQDNHADRCTRVCNQFCNTYGQKFLLLLGIGTICYLGSLYIPHIDSDGSHFNATAIVPPHAKAQTAIQSSAHNLSAQAALFNFKNTRFKARPNDQQRSKRKKQKK